ncbi:MAG: MFS transporter, partial [Polyangiaceae bacterium]|nr:MFS transporter [Polyangiaceae bacterium]
MLALRNFAGLPAAFWKLWIATLVNRLGGFVVPFLSLYLGAERHITPTVAGLIVSCFGVGCMVGGPVGGVLADRVGRKFTVVLGMTFAAATMLVLALQRSPLALGITCLCLGIATEMPRPATNALVADLVDEKDRPRAYGAIYWAANLGFACASLMAGLVSTVSFFALFAADAATCLACAAIVATGVREPERAAAATTSRGIFTQDLARPFRDAAFVSFFAASAMVGLVFFQFHVAMPLDMKAHGITT